MPQRASTVQPAQRSERAELAQGPQGAAQIRVPTNRAELNALGLLREEIRSQLRSTTQLRQELTNQVAQAAALNDNASIRTLQARIRNLETRSASLEQRMLQIDDAMSSAIARGVATAQSEASGGGVAAPPPEAVVAVPPVPAIPPMFGRTDRIGEDGFVSILVGMTLLFTFLGVLIHRRAWRRAEKQYAAVGSGGRAELQQLQQAVDVIAVEVERIAEGQRYVSKLLNERLESPALPAGKEPVPVVLKDGDAPARGR